MEGNAATMFTDGDDIRLESWAGLCGGPGMAMRYKVLLERMGPQAYQ